MNPTVEDVPNELWQIACAREAVIRPLAACGRAGREAVNNAAATLGIHRAYLYRLLSAYRQRPQTSTLIPHHRGRRRDIRLLDPKIESIVKAAINDLYLTRERPRFSDLMKDIRARCHAEQVDAPDYRTVQRRVQDVDARAATTARHGGKRAREQFGATLPQNRPTDPLGFVEIDHSPVDVIIVDEQTRMPLGRPWLSLAVDVATRMAAGFYLSFDAPSALSVALVLAHAVLPKESWLAERQICLPWPVSGIPDWIETDNGEEFHSRVFERGTAEYGIRLTYRPPGRPEAGAHIERLIGTFMHRIHLIPGTTFSNVSDKDNYDSEGRAVMTMKELEHWLALEILGVYHKSVHSALRQPPEQAWKERLAQRASSIRHPQDPTRFLLDFLPGEQRQIRRNGIRIFNIHYWDNILSPLAGRSNCRYTVKYDPRDLSRVFLRDDNGEYWTIPYRDLGAPPVSLWEHRNASRLLRTNGVKALDEKAIFETIAEQRALIAAAKQQTKAQRLAYARTARLAVVAPPKTPPDVAAEENATRLDTEALAPFPVEDWS
jgi:putative transposase